MCLRHPAAPRPRAVALARCLLAGALLAPALSLAADRPPQAYRLEPKAVPDLPAGRASMVRGTASATPQRFYVEHMHMMVPVVVTLRPLDRSARLDLAVGKYPWEPPLRQGTVRDGEAVSFSFRTQGEFQVAVSSPQEGTPYKLLVWVGEEVKPQLAPVVVPASQYSGDGGRWPVAWMAAALGVLLVVALGAWHLRRRKRT